MHVWVGSIPDFLRYAVQNFAHRSIHHNCRIMLRLPKRPSAATVDKVFSALNQALGSNRVSSAEAVRALHGKDLTFHPAAPPDLVCFPGSKEHVQAIMRIAAEHKFPVIPYGAGSSLEGHILAPYGGISLDLSRDMNQIVAVRPEDLDCTVQAGVTRNQLNAHLRDSGLFFTVDPGADATLGGMCSTRASGTTGIRYGTMRDVTVAMEVVLPNGELISTGRRARKSSAGYNLTSLFVGSEGTLGVIVEATLRLVGVPASICAASCTFNTIDDAVMTAQTVIQAGVPVARCELMDEVCVSAVNADSKLGLTEKPMLFFEFHGATETSLNEQMDLVQGVAADFGGSKFTHAFAQEERTKIWNARHKAWHSCTSLKPNSLAWSSDVCVPISQLADQIVAVKKDIQETGLLAPIVGHVGEGNFHCFFIVSHDNPDELRRAREVNERMVRRALACGGTSTGEHGIGNGKRKYLIEEHGAVAVDVMKAVKSAIDPLNIMNPGKIFFAEGEDVNAEH